MYAFETIIINKINYTKCLTSSKDLQNSYISKKPRLGARILTPNTIWKRGSTIYESPLRVIGNTRELKLHFVLNTL